MFWADQTAVLERVAVGHPLAAILNDIVQMIERQGEGLLCTLLLLDEDGVTIRHGAAPSLPVEFTRHLDGERIGPTAGSCGAAAFRRERVIVEDIASHPYWDAYRQFALPVGLRACWSSPIFSAEREVLGTFAIYYREPRGPSKEEIAWVDAATHLAAIAIISDRASKALRRSEARATRLARLFAMSSAINEALVREPDVTRLYEIACRIAVDHGVARLVWIGLVDGASRTVVPAAHAGVGFERVAPILPDLAAQGPGLDPVATALRDGAPVVCNDLEREPAPTWKALAGSPELRSCAIVPMRPPAATAGVLVLHAEPPGAFGTEETAILISVAEDIAFAVQTARTAAALRRSEERLRSVIEHTPDVAIQWYDEAGRLIFYNEASRRLFGWTEQGELGKTLLELGFWASEEEARFTGFRAMAAAGQRVAPARFCFRRPDGSEGLLLSTVFKIPLVDAEHCYVCMDVDLTEHRNMEAAVRAAEILRASIYDCVADVVFYLAVEGGERYRFLSVNRAFLEATGLRDHEVVGRLVDEVIPAPSLALVKAKYAEAIATRGKAVWEEVSRYPSGLKYGEVTVSPIYDADGRCTHLVGTVHDVTERHEAERERRQIEAQLHQAQRLQALGTLAGGIAHDFNNILTAIHCNLDVSLASLGTGHQARDSLVEVKQAAQRATAMVRQILTFSRQDEPRRELLELQPVIQEALQLVSVAIKGNTALRIGFAGDVPRVRGDATQVHQAVMNLVANAAQAIGEAGGVIDVRLDHCDLTPGARSDAPELAAGRYARLTVRDDGPGMDAHTLRRVFDPFFTTKPSGEGTGLGLSVVHGIMKSHGGAVTVRSEPGKGATFELFFPAADQGPGLAAAGAEAGSRKQRVLLVDDDEANVFLARRAFSRLGHQISAHASSFEALREFRSRPADFDVVVVDIAMRQLDAPGLIRELRQIRPEVRIVVTSASLSPEDLASARALGIAQVLDKPHSLDDLAKLVELHTR